MRVVWVNNHIVEVYGDMGGYYGRYDAASAWIEGGEAHIILCNGQEIVVNK